MFPRSCKMAEGTTPKSKYLPGPAPGTTPKSKYFPKKPVCTARPSRPPVKAREAAVTAGSDGSYLPAKGPPPLGLDLPFKKPPPSKGPPPFKGPPPRRDAPPGASAATADATEIHGGTIGGGITGRMQPCDVRNHSLLAKACVKEEIGDAPKVIPPPAVLCEEEPVTKPGPVCKRPAMKRRHRKQMTSESKLKGTGSVAKSSGTAKPHGCRWR